MEFTERITIEDQKKLSSDDQKDYLRFLFAKEGNEAEVKAIDESDFLLPTGGGADPADNPGALPEPPGKPLAATQTETDDHGDLPPSIRGELGSLEDIPSEAPAEGEEGDSEVGEVAAPAEEAPAEGAPAEEVVSPFMKVNDQTSYNTEEEARKGFDEKDRTIQTRDEELRLAKQENELLARERESYKIRMESEQRAAELAPPPAPEAEVKPDEVVTPPSADELYAIWDDVDKGPLEAMKLMMPHAIQDLGINKLIALAEKLDHLKADEFIEKLQVLGTPDIIQSFHEDFINGTIDEKFPEFEGKWRDPKDPVGIAYQQKFHEIDKSYIDRVGAPLSEIAERSPESVQWVIGEVLSRMDVPSNNGDTPGVSATTDPPDTPTDPPHTDGTETGEPERRLTREEAEAIASRTADIAVKAVREQGRLHGQTQTEASGAKKSQPATTQKEWTKEAIRKDPLGWAKSRKSDPNFQKATLDMLPQVRE